MVLLIMMVDKPEPLLKAKHLLMRAAPCSLSISEPDPALGKVIVTVEVKAAFSVTTTSPLERVVTDAEDAFAC